MKKMIFTTITVVIAAFANAQWQPTGNLTFFSDNGQKFYVILNGEKYNNVAETNVRIEELPNPYYSCKIIFENPAIPEISKNMVMVTDQNGVFMDVTYRIKQGSNGKYTIGAFPYSFIPAQQNMARPAGASVYRYGVPGQLYNYNTQPTAVSSTTTVVTQPSQTVVVTQPVPTMSVNVPGMSVNVNAPIVPATTTVVSTPTYSTQTTYTSQTNYSNNAPNNNYGCRTAMNPNDFQAAKQTVANTSFDETKLSTAQSIVSSNCLSSDQILSLMNTFSFEQSKLDFAKAAYQNCVDKNNYFKITNAFSFSSSKEDLNNYIQTVR